MRKRYLKTDLVGCQEDLAVVYLYIRSCTQVCSRTLLLLKKKKYVLEL